VDVLTTEDITLTDNSVHRIPVNAHGPLPLGHDLSALLLGCSSIRAQGIFVSPGVIDADYTGPIQAMVWTPSPPVSIQAGTRLAQLVPFYDNVPCVENKERGSGRFGSTGQEKQIMWALEIQNKKPKMIVPLTLNNVSLQFDMLIDTGADVTVISEAEWPRD